VILFSAHVDDEVIGCWRQLSAGMVSDVYYFFDMTDQRKFEATTCAEKYKFTPHFIDDFKCVKFPADEVILVPNVNDLHIHHKQVNRFAKSLPNKKLYYSVDMNVKFDVLSVEAQQEKKSALLTLFPSQQKLLENEKYHLFESLIEDDSHKMIWVTFQKKGLHYYQQASTDPNLVDVQYLGNVHRHLFKFKVSIEVNHSDREIEFHLFQNWLESLYDKNILDCDRKSCEMLADDLSLAISKEYSDRRLIIEVSEDGENGCTCEYQI
jgi:hypothetical protein